MKTLAWLILGLTVLAGGGYTAYRFGVAPLLTGGRAPGGPPSASGETTPAGGVEGDAAPAAGGSASGEPAPVSPLEQLSIARAGQGATNAAVEVRLLTVRTAATVGDLSAGEGREFAIVETAWKNIIPKVKVDRTRSQDRTGGAGALGFGGGTAAENRTGEEASAAIESVPFLVEELSNHLWLVVDGRFVEPIDADATEALDPHLGPERLSIAAFEQVVSGSVAFQAAAGATSLALLYLDSSHGHLLLPLKGAPPVPASSLRGGSRSNEFVDLAVAGASWTDAAGGGTGVRTLVVSLKGISRQNALVDVPFGGFAFLQTDQGCVAQPDDESAAVSRPLSPTGRFLPFVPNEGQLAFTVPAGTRSAVFMLRARPGGAIDLPVVGDGGVRKPSASATHTDGTVLRLSVVGTAAPPAGLAPPSAGLEHLVVDYLVENLNSESGLELQPEYQFALADTSGTTHEPEDESGNLPCRLTGDNVVPPGGWRRFSLLYAVPAGLRLTLQYRGFESAGTLKVR